MKSFMKEEWIEKKRPSRPEPWGAQRDDSQSKETERELSLRCKENPEFLWGSDHFAKYCCCGFLSTRNPSM